MSRVLLIDDDELVRVSLMKVLENAGHEVVTAGDGNEGMKFFKENDFDIVITDLIMPEKDGIETILDMKKTSPDMPIIAISGGGRFSNPDLYLSSAREFGAVTVLAKPFALKEFLDAVQTGLAGRE